MKRHCSPTLRLGHLAFLVVAALLASGCGASTGLGGESTAMNVPGQPTPQNVSEAEALFARSEHDVFAAFGEDKRDMQRGFAQPPPGQFAPQPTSPATTAAESSPPPPPADSYRPKKEDEVRAAAGVGATDARTGGDSPPLSSNPCVTACKALASMDRAAAHLCELAGYGDARCTNARERVRAATERVRQSCSDCNGQ